MQQQYIGNMVLGSAVDVTDPCADQDAACRLRVPILPGAYEAWCQYSEPSPWGSYVVALWLKKSDVAFCALPPDGAWTSCGKIGVDSGIAGFFDRKPDLHGAAWEEFVDRTPDSGCVLDKLDGRDAFWCRTCGDGVYRVYACGRRGVLLYLEDEE